MLGSSPLMASNEERSSCGLGLGTGLTGKHVGIRQPRKRHSKARLEM